MHFTVLGASLALLGACGSPTTRATLPPHADEAAAGFRDVAERWSQREDEVLAALGGGDPTLAQRFGDVPALDGPDSEVETDWLALRLRTEGVSKAEHALAQWADSARLPRTANGAAWELRLERELVIRAVREERFRLEHESALPRGASALVRAMVMTVGITRPLPGQPPREGWVDRRLDEIRIAARDATLDTTELAELEDALDALERGASPSTTAGLVRLRVELESLRRAPARSAELGRLEQALGAHAGTSLPLPVVRSRLERAEVGARDAVASFVARVSAEDARAAEKEAVPLLFRTASCGEPENSSRMRRAAPPPERAAACAEVRLARDANGDKETLAMWIVLHDHLAVALWSLARADGAQSPDAAVMGHRLLSAMSPEARARLARLASVQPTVAVTAGLAADMLARRGPFGTAGVAKAWAAFGDAPLDVVEREVLAKMP